jgi:predicted XRE-type DNA-binding protein
MKKEPLEVVRGSGNVFRDLERADADLLQMKALLATEIIKVLNHEGLTVRQAHARTGIAAADFSRIRNADLARFTLDRLVGVLTRLGSRVELRLKVGRVRGESRATLA